MFDRILRLLRQKSTLLAIGLILALATPVTALDVEVLPKAPQLGDTIEINIATQDFNSKPTVTLEGKDYPVFIVGDRYRALLPTSPLDRSGKYTLQVTGEGTTKNLGVWVKNRVFPVQRIWLTDSKASLEATQLELDRVGSFKKLVTPEQYWQGSFVRPNAGAISTVYGVRRYYNGEFANDYYHKGVDYAGSEGSLVVAPAAGVVRLVGKEAEGFRVHGNIIGIDHGQGVTSLFLHLKDIYVGEGDIVKPGQNIGSVGDTGASAGPHLHWGLYVHSISVDPAPWRFGEVK
jgi:murein DD-endopeptidase MepM/ murein hydrolase activator NlpD